MSVLRLHPAGNCKNCGLEIEETHHRELIARGAGLGPDRLIAILIHSGSGHERCAGRDTCAEREDAATAG